MNKYLPSLFSALLMGVAQQPWGFGFLAWFSLVPFIYCINQQKTYTEIIKQSLVLIIK